MKGLLKYLSPFSPDQSGAVSVLFSLGGIIVIADAGGCTGNICGFDEPRWFQKKSAIFSAGLRDMDAILGRDDRLVDKLKDAASYVDGNFAAIIGTPVPAVIATDLKAMKRMAAKRCGIPVMTVGCTGTRLYDAGAEEAYQELFTTFAEDDIPKEENSVGILGLIPLDVSRLEVRSVLEPYYQKQGFEHVYCYGMGDELDAVRRAGRVTKNIAVSPAAVKTAEYLKKRFGTPYEIAYPLFSESFLNTLPDDLSGKKILIIHQQAAACELRNILRERGVSDITVGTWFMEIPELKEAGDLHFEREEAFIESVIGGGYDAVIADPAFKRALKAYEGDFIPMNHFAVSGTFAEENELQKQGM